MLPKKYHVFVIHIHHMAIYQDSNNGYYARKYSKLVFSDFQWFSFQKPFKVALCETRFHKSE